MSAYLFREGDRLAITLAFCRQEHLQRYPEHVGAIFVAEIDAEEFIEILRTMLAVLDEKPAPPAP